MLGRAWSVHECKLRNSKWGPSCAAAGQPSSQSLPAKLPMQAASGGGCLLDRLPAASLHSSVARFRQAPFDTWSTFASRYLVLCFLNGHFLHIFSDLPVTHEYRISDHLFTGTIYIIKFWQNHRTNVSPYSDLPSCHLPFPTTGFRKLGIVTAVRELDSYLNHLQRIAAGNVGLDHLLGFPYSAIAKTNDDYSPRKCSVITSNSNDGRCDIFLCRILLGGKSIRLTVTKRTPLATNTSLIPYMSVRVSCPMAMTSHILDITKSPPINGLIVSCLLPASRIGSLFNPKH